MKSANKIRFQINFQKPRNFFMKSANFRKGCIRSLRKQIHLVEVGNPNSSLSLVDDPNIRLLCVFNQDSFNMNITVNNSYLKINITAG